MTLRSMHSCTEADAELLVRLQDLRTDLVAPGDRLFGFGRDVALDILQIDLVIFDAPSTSPWLVSQRR